jgi:hypothetical protein
MKQFLIVLLLLISSLSLYSQENQKTAAELKKEMAQIRRETNWGDEEESKIADAKIQELSKQLMIIGAQKQAAQNGATGAQDTSKIKEIVEYKMQLWNQMWKIAGSGDESHSDLAAPLRDEITEEYKEDENPTIKNPVWRDSMPDLTINMSMPQVQVIIDQMPVFRGIKRLIIICEQKGTAVDLDQILRNAENYQLTELYILNFGPSVTNLPSQVGNFKGLTILNLLNNNLHQLPSSIAGLSDLKVLYVDFNPVTQLFQVVSPLKKLERLGIAKTEISESEIELLQQALPECNILTQ